MITFLLFIIALPMLIVLSIFGLGLILAPFYLIGQFIWWARVYLTIALFAVFFAVFMTIILPLLVQDLTF